MNNEEYADGVAMICETIRSAFGDENGLSVVDAIYRGLTDQEGSSLVDAIYEAADSSRKIAHAIMPPVCGNTDASGGHVASLTEAVMGMTKGLVSIANAIESLASSVDAIATSNE